MKYNPEIHKRRSIRLKGYDYSKEGMYFITICVQNRECLFGKIEQDEMILNDAGKMVYDEWEKLKTRFPNIELHEFVVMPNHFHGILEIVHPVGATLVVAQNNTANDGNANTNKTTPIIPGQPQFNNTGNSGQLQSLGQPQGIAPTAGKTVGDMMDAFKSITTVEYIRGVKNCGWHPFNGKLWQRNYYEHIIRNQQSYEIISQYIINNPAKWNKDKFFKRRK